MARILVVDDEIAIRSAIQHALEPAGHDVTLAVDGSRLRARYESPGQTSL